MTLSDQDVLAGGSVLTPTGPSGTLEAAFGEKCHLAVAQQLDVSSQPISSSMHTLPAAPSAN